MTILLVTTDLHLNSKARDRYRHDWVSKELPRLIGNNDVDELVILGDLTDDTDNHPASLVNEITDHIYNLSRSCYVHVLRGNHDYVDANCPFFKFIENMPKVSWINSPTRTVLGYPHHALFLPHTHDYKTDWADVDFDDVSICFTHQTFAGTVSESGKELSGIPLSAIPADLPVYSGDIHQRQTVGHVTYVGAPYTIDFGDDYKPRVVLIESDGKTRSLACNGPQKRMITTDIGGEITKLLRSSSASGDIIKLRVTVGNDRVADWPGIKRRIIEDAQKMGARLHAIEAVMDVPAALASRKRYKASAKTKADDQVLRAYCIDQAVTQELTAEGLTIIDKG